VSVGSRIIRTGPYLVVVGEDRSSTPFFQPASQAVAFADHDEIRAVRSSTPETEAAHRARFVHSDARVLS
jgi:hypothetical protein